MSSLAIMAGIGFVCAFSLTSFLLYFVCKPVVKTINRCSDRKTKLAAINQLPLSQSRDRAVSTICQMV